MARDSALMVLYDSDKRIMLQLRDENARTYKNQWGFFGGGIKAGESSMDALVRETFDELMHKPVSLELAFVIDDPDETGMKKYFFVEKCIDKTRLDLHESKGMRWFNFVDAEKIIPEPYKFCIRKLAEFIG